MSPSILLSFTYPTSSVDSASGEEWSAWSVCSATCGEGWQGRTRLCVSSSYSTQCSGPLREQRPCNNSAVCPGKPTPHPLPPIHLPALTPARARDPLPSSLSKRVAPGGISTLTMQKGLCLQLIKVERFTTEIHRDLIVFSGSPTCRQAGRLLNSESNIITRQYR